MKIAILTLPIHFNYGGIIQNYALQTILKQRGHDVVTININRPPQQLPPQKKPFIYAKRFIKKILGRKDGIIFLEKKINADKVITRQYVRKFIQEHIHLTTPLYSKAELIDYDFNKFDMVIVGSDQVWRIPFAYPDIETYFLDFIHNKNTKKVAFSASFGTDVIEFSKQQIASCRKYIKDFEIVTVREKSAINIINKIYKWECKKLPIQTVDPTMLLSKEDYINLSAQYINNRNKGKLFYYILDMNQEKKQIINKISADLGIEVFTVKNMKSNLLDNAENRIIPPLEEWLQAFNEASFVFTDSFHGSVFSLIFNKELLIISNKERGLSRFESLIDLFNITDRLIYNQNGYNKDIFKHTINWNSVNLILKEERQKFIDIFKLLDL